MKKNKHWTHCRAVVLHCKLFLFLSNPCAFTHSFKASELYNWNISFQSAVTLDDVFSFLMDFRADESLCRGTQIWNRVCCIRDTGRSTQPYVLKLHIREVVWLTICYPMYLWHCCSRWPGCWTVKAVSSPGLWMEIVLVLPQRKKL